MASVRVSTKEAAYDFAGVLAKVREGAEIILQQDDADVAVIRSIGGRSGRPVAAILREARERNSTATLDDDFTQDLTEAITAQRTPWNPPSWD